MTPQRFRRASAIRPVDVVVAGGGIAGIEAVLALRDLGEERLRVHVVAAHPSFSLRPQLLGEPWGRPPLRLGLVELCTSFGARFTPARIGRVDTAARRLWTTAGAEIPYDRLLLAPGGRLTLPYPLTRVLGFGSLPRTLAQAETGSVEIVVPPRTSWTLPAYELALLTAGEHPGRSVRVVTDERTPLDAFGPGAEAEIRAFLARHGVTADCGRPVGLGTDPSDLADTVVALPLVQGPGLHGVATDPRGFVQAGSDMAVPGADDVWAAGDAVAGTVKQGGIAAQQADVAAAAIVRSAGGPAPRAATGPVLRGKLAAGGEELYLRRVLNDSHAGQASEQPLWMPPSIVCAWRLARWLTHEGGGSPASLEHVGGPVPGAVPAPGPGAVPV
ncbi:hypothetical protein NBH00_08960 [Paraconexibacter antarcticus]|uniref:Uncharacterized protein n=1 Tax=Paraconexibacter antarcticus TaxID=2949664 RepID=A0ABY5DZQ9_9ACTN|nr:hypothetical protein [Paraconexibacter antarcticus]UTI66322.1 hypothetical protein NBH00_08960 [Paraconexibacter antarcticus]